MFPKDFYTYLDTHTLVGVKAGKDREKFTKIWMLHINDRVFARSWYKKERSWFSAFLQHKKGEINYGGKILKVKAVKLDSKDAMHKKINKAYIEKYTQPGHVMYATGFSDPGYADYTMEFIV
jgi:hypothetical protein